MKNKKIEKLIFFVLLCEIAGSIGAISVSPAILGWYSYLVKPFFNPPNWVFAPVWTILYALMGISLYLVLEKKLKKEETTKLVLIFGVQFLLNIVWSFLFFGLHSPLFGFIDIILLVIAILINIFSFYKVSKGAGLILLPYLFWVLFASILNFYVLILN